MAGSPHLGGLSKSQAVAPNPKFGGRLRTTIPDFPVCAWSKGRSPSWNLVFCMSMSIITTVGLGLEDLVENTDHSSQSMF